MASVVRSLNRPAMQVNHSSSGRLEVRANGKALGPLLLIVLVAVAVDPPPPPTPIVAGSVSKLKTVKVERIAWDPVEGYDRRTLLGWKVLVNKKFLAANASLAERTLVHLQDHLYRITHMLPPPASAKLRQIPIWVEEKHPKHPCMCYHVSAEWLRNNDMNPEKAGAVEIANAANFLERSKQQPWMVLHEMAHGYHHKFLADGYENKDVLRAYRNAMEKKLYDSVLDSAGGKRKHYACNNQMEYFAEATEAYFGVNDFHPFVRAELKVYDPAGYAMIGKLWNE